MAQVSKKDELAIDHELILNLQRAAAFDANNTYPVVFQYLGYRKRIAEELLIEKGSERYQELSEIYDRVNSTIKQILGI